MQWNFGKKELPLKVVRETVIPEPSYSIPAVLAGDAFSIHAHANACKPATVMIAILRHLSCWLLSPEAVTYATCAVVLIGDSHADTQSEMQVSLLSVALKAT